MLGAWPLYSAVPKECLAFSENQCNSLRVQQEKQVPDEQMYGSPGHQSDPSEVCGEQVESTPQWQAGKYAQRQRVVGLAPTQKPLGWELSLSEVFRKG